MYLLQTQNAVQGDADGEAIEILCWLRKINWDFSNSK